MCGSSEDQNMLKHWLRDVKKGHKSKKTKRKRAKLLMLHKIINQRAKCPIGRNSFKHIFLLAGLRHV